MVALGRGSVSHERGTSVGGWASRCGSVQPLITPLHSVYGAKPSCPGVRNIRPATRFRRLVAHNLTTRARNLQPTTSTALSNFLLKFDYQI